MHWQINSISLWRNFLFHQDNHRKGSALTIYSFVKCSSHTLVQLGIDHIHLWGVVEHGRW